MRTPAGPASGDKLDRYELLCLIAEGGMASVWVARLRGKHGFERLFAIKTILPRFADSARFRAMFLDEARIASRIEHPNVVQVFDLGEARDVLYLVMEYVDGDSLSKLNRACQRKAVPIPAGIALRVLADACAGLHEAHELKDGDGKPLGIVHRDISPHNVLVSTKGIAKLIDFGIAKTQSSDEGGESGVLKGKIQYMAPEQALGRPVDRRADVWAVGAILYHLVAGRPPYEGDDKLTTLHLLGSGLPPQPLPNDVHPAVAAVVRKALTQDPAKRHASAAELREAIERAMAVAQLTTTSAEVAAFAALHLGDRARRRRDAIEQAAAVIADRVRLEGARAAATLAGDAASSPSGFVPRATAATPRVPFGTPWPGPVAPARTRSEPALGSAPPSSSTPLPAPARRRPALALAAFVVGFAGVAGASMTVLHAPRPRTAAALAAVAGAHAAPVIAPERPPGPASAAPAPAPPALATAPPAIAAASAPRPTAGAPSPSTAVPGTAAPKADASPARHFAARPNAP
ncbi:MAG TPA: protein kinase [Polyangiaceae bacterium]|nr:protein kinase [Polyangiaceae bacterium]